MKVSHNLLLILVTIFSQIRRWILGPHAIGVLYESGNGLLISGPADMYVGGNLGFRGCYELETLAPLKALVNKESRVLVLGSHVGSFAIPLANDVREIVIYEANPETFRLLQFNLILNNIRNCQAFNLAVGDKPGKVGFFAHSVNSGGSKRIPAKKSFALNFGRPKTIEVEMVRLSDHITNPQFDLVLMDIEGCEGLALRGMGAILSACSHLQFEYYPEALEQVGGTTPGDLAALLGEHFSELRLHDSNLRAQQPDFLSFLHDVGRKAERADILAIK